MLPLELFRDPNFAFGNPQTFAIYGGLGASLLPRALPAAGRRLRRAGRGLATLPITIVMFSSRAASGRLADRYGPRLFMGLGPLVAALGLLLLQRVDADRLLDRAAPGVLLFALGLSATVAPLTAAVLAEADEHNAGIASGVNNAIARVAGLLAVAAIGAVVAAQFNAQFDACSAPGRSRRPASTAAAGTGAHARARRAGQPAPAEARRLDQAAEAASVRAFHTGVGIAAALVALGGVLGLVGIRNPRRDVSCESCPGGAARRRAHGSRPGRAPPSRPKRTPTSAHRAPIVGWPAAESAVRRLDSCQGRARTSSSPCPTWGARDAGRAWPRAPPCPPWARPRSASPRRRRGDRPGRRRAPLVPLRPRTARLSGVDGRPARASPPRAARHPAALRATSRARSSSRRWRGSWPPCARRACPRRVVVDGGGGGPVLLVLGPPLSLTDVFNYLHYGRMAALYGLNPYARLPLPARHGPGLPVLQLAPPAVALRPAVHAAHARRSRRSALAAAYWAWKALVAGRRARLAGVVAWTAPAPRALAAGRRSRSSGSTRSCSSTASAACTTSR